MATEIKTVIYPVKDIAAAKAQFTKLLGVEPVMDEPFYVQFSVGGREIGLDPNGHSKGMDGPITYLLVDNIEDSFKQLVDGGAQVKQEITDVGNGQRFIASVTDADGNVIGLVQSAF